MDIAAALRWTLAAALTATAGYHAWHALRPGPARARSRDVDAVHAAMGLVMAGLLAGIVGTVAGWLLVGGFATATLWFASGYLAGTAGRRSYVDLRQSACCVAMTAMLALPLLAPSGMPGMTGMTGGAARGPLLALLVGQLLVAAWTARDLRRTSHDGVQLATALGGACMLALML